MVRPLGVVSNLSTVLNVLKAHGAVKVILLSLRVLPVEEQKPKARDWLLRLVGAR